MAANEKHYCSCFTIDNLSPEAQQVLMQSKAALLKDAKWPVGSIITIRFLEGDPGLQQRVRKVGEEWTRLANLTFSFVDHGPASVRISFVKGNGSWSYLGTMCKSVREPQATMNFGWLTPASSDDDVRSVVLHEFGHMLGLIHEHQNPNGGGIDWNRDAVINDLGGPPNNWNLATIEHNMFQKYAPHTLDSIPLDSTSIMMYPIPLAWTRDGTTAGFNSRLSDKDKEFIKTNYPH